MNKRKQLRLDYLGFFVGLLDGDGSIQVNHWRKKILQYRIVIKLKNTELNLKMLTLLRLKIGFGIVRIEKSKENVLYVINYKKDIIKMIKILDKYKPLAIRKRYQLMFLKDCLSRGCVTWYLSNRSLKYSLYTINSNLLLKDIFYFKSWFSGFTEAEGCFTLRKNSSFVLSYSLSQKGSCELLSLVKFYLDESLKVRNVNNFYSLEIYKKEVLFKLQDHFASYPLLGEQITNYLLFIKYFKR